MATVQEKQVEKLKKFLQDNFEETPYQGDIGSNSEVKFHRELICNGDFHKNVFAIWAGRMQPEKITSGYTEMLNYLKELLDRDSWIN